MVNKPINISIQEWVPVFIIKVTTELAMNILRLWTTYINFNHKHQLMTTAKSEGEAIWPREETSFIFQRWAHLCKVEKYDSAIKIEVIVSQGQ